MRPLIGLNCSISEDTDPLKTKAFCHLKYIDAVAGAGGIPVIVPPALDREALERVLAKLDGFCLIGGPDYLPEHYGGRPQPAEELMTARRHHFDLLLAEVLLEKTQQPVLGICGGQQLLNISRGGALVQDLQSEWKASDSGACTLQHSDDERKNSTQAGNVYRHDVRLEPGSRIAEIAGAKTLRTNSYHHQAVDPNRIGSGFKATAWSPDGVIEVIENSADERFILGVQWHPERQTEEPQQKAIFEALIAAAQRRE